MNNSFLISLAYICDMIKIGFDLFPIMYNLELNFNSFGMSFISLSFVLDWLISLLILLSTEFS